MTYLAKFENIGGSLFRFDTRIYLGNYDSSVDSTCIGAIVGKNPGNAKPNTLGVLDNLSLDRDNMLPSVRNRFLTVYKLKGLTPPTNAFVRVWNLFYLCNKDLLRAKKELKTHQSLPICNSEMDDAPITWFAWGGSDKFLNIYKSRFIGRQYNQPFFYDYNINAIQNKIPTVIDSVKHTQGMPKHSIERYLANIIG